MSTRRLVVAKVAVDFVWAGLGLRPSSPGKLEKGVQPLGTLL